MIGVELQEPLQDAIAHAIKFGALSDDDLQTLEIALASKHVSSSALKVVKSDLSKRGNDLLKVLQGSRLMFPYLCEKKEKQVNINQHCYDFIAQLPSALIPCRWILNTRRG